MTFHAPTIEERMASTFAVLIKCALADERCPMNGKDGIDQNGIRALARAGRIRIEVYGNNYRVVTILEGPHQGKHTAPYRNPEARPYMVIDGEDAMTFTSDFPDIPDFLRATGPGDPCPALVKATRRAKTRAKRHPFDLPKTIEPAGWALLRQIEKEKRERQAERLAALREQRLASRRAKSKTSRGVA